MADPSDHNQKKVTEKIGRKAERKMKARERHHGGLLFGLGMFGLVGWAVAVPTILGIALGVWLDTRFPSDISWTLTFLFLGVVLGCLNAWYWVKKESRHDES
jgi:ATP synthase protein I